MAGQYDRIVQPGATGRIPLTVSTRNRNGKLTKTATVYTNIPGKDSVVRLTIKGEVWMPVAATPLSASFGRITMQAAKQQSLKRKITIVNNMDEPANITNVRSTNPVFKADVRTIEPGRKFELTVTLASTPRRGGNSGRIEMATGVKAQPKLSVTASVYVMGDVDVYPNRLLLFGNRARQQQRLITVRNNTEQPLKISELKCTNPKLKVQLKEIIPGRQYRVNVTIPADCKLSPGGDRITFKTDCPSVPEVTIPVAEYKPRTRVTRPSVKLRPLPKAGGNQPVRTPASRPVPVQRKPKQ